MTIPELPEHQRFKVNKYSIPTFLIGSCWIPICSLDSFNLESCIAIARCYFSDKANEACRFHSPTMENPEYKKSDAKLARRMFDLEKQWRLYGESRK